MVGVVTYAVRTATAMGVAGNPDRMNFTAVLREQGHDYDRVRLVRCGTVGVDAGTNSAPRPSSGRSTAAPREPSRPPATPPGPSSTTATRRPVATGRPGPDPDPDRGLPVRRAGQS